MKIGLFSMAFLVLLVLKLTEVIMISWWWVFSPLIIATGFWFSLVFLVGIGVVTMSVIEKRVKK